MSIELFTAFLARHQNCSQDEIQMIEGDPLQVIYLLGPFLRAMEEPTVAAFVKSAPYDPAGEAPFNLMLEGLATDPEAAAANHNNAVLTVWSERLDQVVGTMLINKAAGITTALPPTEMAENLRQVAVALLWLHKLDLPFAIGTTAEVLATATPGRTLQSEPTTASDRPVSVDAPAQEERGVTLVSENDAGVRVEVEICHTLEALAARTGILHPDKIDWMLPILKSLTDAGQLPAQIASALKNAGTLLTAAQKRERGLNPRIRVGDLLAETLTEVGLADLPRAAHAIANTPHLARNVLLHRALIAHDNVAARFDAPSQSKCCASAATLNGASFPRGHSLMPVPLVGCDAWECGCCFHRNPQGDPQRAAELQRGVYDARLASIRDAERRRRRPIVLKPEPEELSLGGKLLVSIGIVFVMILFFAFGHLVQSAKH